MKESNNRDASIDILRFIALSGLILAHTAPPPIFLQLRSFDVPMMVFLSGVAFSLSSGNKATYSTYVWKRFKRLILPMWIFVIMYTVFTIAIGNGFPGLTKLLFEYAIPIMNNWYTWIIRVFFIIALVAPLVSKYVSKIALSQYWYILLITLVIYESLCWLSTNLIYINIIMNIFYRLIFSLGIMVHRISNKELFIISTIAFTAFLILSIFISYEKGHFIITGNYKYPPKIYYISYAIGATTLLYQFRKQIEKIIYGFSKFKVDKICSFIGSHTIWIYFYHILMLDIFYDKLHWSIRYIIVYTSSILLASCQDTLAYYIMNKIGNDNVKKNINIIFRG